MRMGMNKTVIEKMLAEKKKVVVCGQELEIEQLTMRELAKFAELQQQGKLSDAIMYIVKTTLKKSDPEITDEMIEKLKANFVNELLTKILEINELTIDKKKLSESSV